MSQVTTDALRKFASKNLFMQYLAAGSGFFLGAKLCDLIFFEGSRYDALREDLEDEFWAKNGEPKLIAPYIVPSQKAGQEHVMRKSWIYIMYDKDKIVPKKEDLD